MTLATLLGPLLVAALSRLAMLALAGLTAMGTFAVTFVPREVALSAPSDIVPLAVDEHHAVPAATVAGWVVIAITWDAVEIDDLLTSFGLTFHLREHQPWKHHPKVCVPADVTADAAGADKYQHKSG